jgi:hypothetical protein
LAQNKQDFGFGDYCQDRAKGVSEKSKGGIRKAIKSRISVYIRMIRLRARELRLMASQHRKI